MMTHRCRRCWGHCVGDHTKKKRNFCNGKTHLPCSLSLKLGYEDGTCDDFPLPGQEIF